MEAADENGAFPAVVQSDFPAYGEGFGKILFYVLNGIAAIEVYPAFKMQVEGAVVHVDGAHDGDLIVTEIAFCVDKTRSIFINTDPGTDEGGIIGLGEQENELFVRDAGSDNAHINTSFRRHAQFLLHFIVDNKIGGGNIHISGGVLKYIHIHVFAECHIVQGCVGIRLDIALLGAWEDGIPGQVLFTGDIGVPDEIPHFQKHDGMAFHRIAFQADAGILPVSVGMGDIKIFVRQIKASGEADTIIDYGYFAVIPVVHENVKERDEGVENAALDSLLVQAAHEFRFYITDASKVIIYKTYLHAFGNFLQKDFFDPAEGFRILHREIFHENKLPGIFQIFQECLQGRFRLGIVYGLCVAVYGIAAGTADIGFLVMDVYIFFPETPEYMFILFQFGTVFSCHLFIIDFRSFGNACPAKHQIQDNAEQGEGEDYDGPYKPGCGKFTFGIDPQNNDKSDNFNDGCKPYIVLVQLPDERNEPGKLDEQTEDGKQNTSEYDLQNIPHSIPPGFILLEEPIVYRIILL